MSDDLRVDVVGLSLLVRRFEQGSRRAQLAMGRATRLALEHLRDKVVTYPGKQSQVPANMRGRWFKTDKQRRWFFAALRRGEIQVPYRRTGTLGRRWAIEVQLAGDVLGILGNATPYARRVQDLAQQAQIHQGNWKTVQEIATEERAAVVGYYAREVKALVE